MMRVNRQFDICSADLHRIYIRRTCNLQSEAGIRMACLYFTLMQALERYAKVVLRMLSYLSIYACQDVTIWALGRVVLAGTCSGMRD